MKIMILQHSYHQKHYKSIDINIPRQKSLQHVIIYTTHLVTLKNCAPFKNCV